MRSIVLSALILITVSSCDQKTGDNNENTQHDTVITTDTVVKSDTADTDRDIDDFREASKRRMDELDHRLDSLEVKWKEKRGINKEKYAAKRDELKKRSKELKERLDSNRQTSGERWDEFKEEFNHDMDNLGKSIEDLFEDNKK